MYAWRCFIVKPFYEISSGFMEVSEYVSMVSHCHTYSWASLSFETSINTQVCVRGILINVRQEGKLINCCLKMWWKFSGLNAERGWKIVEKFLLNFSIRNTKFFRLKLQLKKEKAFKNLHNYIFLKEHLDTFFLFKINCTPFIPYQCLGLGI